MANWYKTKLDYDSSGNLVYIGKSPTAEQKTSDGGWYIKKLSYDSSANMIRIEKTVGAWDDRASLGWE